ncbi:hypothetical protein BKA82DRAFT_11568, partial [Pisolithus tinctorius]
PQYDFPVHQGILDYNGVNTVAVALWAMESIPISPTLKLTAKAVYEGDIFDLSPSPGPLECEDLAIIEHCYAVGKTKWELFASCCPLHGGPRVESEGNAKNTMNALIVNNLHFKELVVHGSSSYFMKQIASFFDVNWWASGLALHPNWAQPQAPNVTRAYTLREGQAIHSLDTLVTTSIPEHCEPEYATYLRNAPHVRHAVFMATKSYKWIRQFGKAHSLDRPSTSGIHWKTLSGGTLAVTCLE